MLAPQLISNETSNLAGSYMSIRSCLDGGKQYNHIKSGGFQYKCHSVGKHGPDWPLTLWQETTGRDPRTGITTYIT
jgi:hypothetical protein